MTAEEVKKFIRGLTDLSTLPVLLDRIIAVANDENAGIEELHRAVSYDQALAQRIIRVANSVFFGHSGQIRDIHQAVLFLGMDRVKTIALGMSVLNVFPGRSSMSVRNLWAHGYETAFLASVISETTSITHPQECFLAGLLHDAGRIVFYTMNASAFETIETTDSMLDQERSVFGCTHAESGAWFAEGIGLPSGLTAVIRFHHNPSAVQEDREIVSIVSLAEGLSRQLSPRLEDDGIWTPELNAILLELSLSDSDIRSIAGRFNEIKPEIEKVFA